MEQTDVIPVLNKQGIVATMLELVPTMERRLMTVDEMLAIVDKIAYIRHADMHLTDSLCNALYDLLVFFKMHNVSETTMFFWRMHHINSDINIQYAYAISNLLNYRIEEQHRIRNVVDKLITVANLHEIDLSDAFPKFVQSNHSQYTV